MKEGVSVLIPKKRLTDTVLDFFRENMLVERLEIDDASLSFINTDYLFWRMSCWCVENQKATCGEEKRP